MSILGIYNDMIMDGVFLKYTTRKSTNDVLSAINSRIHWNEELSIINARNKYSFKEFEGFIDNNVFTIRRILKVGANSFIPIVKIKILRENQNNVLEAHIVLQKFTRVFLIGLSLFIGVLFILLLSTGDIFNFISLGFILVLFLPWIFTYFLFKSEIKKVDEFIKQILI